MREKRCRRFSTHDLKEQIRAVRDLQRARSAKFPAQLATSAEREVPRAGFARVSYHTARRKRRTVCPHKELQSACISFVTFEKMKYINLRPAGAVPQAATGASASERGGRARVSRGGRDRT